MTREDDIQNTEYKIFKVNYRSDLSQLEEVRRFIRNLCSKNGRINEQFIDELQLAINEAFCNISKHGYRGNLDGEITIRGEQLENGLMLDLYDRGETFYPEELPEPSLKGDRENGFGWYLIKEIADSFSYLQKKDKDGWNHLRIIKHYGDKEMEITHETHGSVLIITPHVKALDAKDAPDFKEKSIALIDANHAKKVILDLNQLTFIDSSGLGSFLSILRYLNQNSGKLRLACLNKPVQTMFELVSMNKIFSINKTTDEALRSFL